MVLFDLPAASYSMIKCRDLVQVTVLYNLCIYNILFLVLYPVIQGPAGQMEQPRWNASRGAIGGTHPNPGK